MGKSLQSLTAASVLFATGCERADGKLPAEIPLGYRRAGQGGGFYTDEVLTPFGDVVRCNNFYEFGADKGDPARLSGNFKTEPWSVTVEGEVDKPGTYTLEDILKPHALEERIYRLRCVEAWPMVVPCVEGLRMMDEAMRPLTLMALSSNY